MVRGKCFSAVGVWVDTYTSELLTVVATIGMGVMCNFATSHPEEIGYWFGLGGCGVLYAFGVILGTRRSTTFAQLERTVKTLQNRIEKHNSDYFNSINEQLALISTGVLELGNSERISLYRAHQMNFTLLGRYSLNPELRKRGRSVYPINEGCISIAWQHGKYCKDRLPDPQANSATYEAAQLSKLAMPTATVRLLSMKSRSYFSIALCDRGSQNRIAVVVVESTKNKFANKDLLDRNLSGAIGKLLAHLVESLKATEPDPTLASKEGF